MDQCVCETRESINTAQRNLISIIWSLHCCYTYAATQTYTHTHLEHEVCWLVKRGGQGKERCVSVRCVKESACMELAAGEHTDTLQLCRHTDCMHSLTLDHAVEGGALEVQGLAGLAGALLACVCVWCVCGVVSERERERESILITGTVLLWCRVSWLGAMRRAMQAEERFKSSFSPVTQPQPHSPVHRQRKFSAVCEQMETHSGEGESVCVCVGGSVPSIHA